MKSREKVLRRRWLAAYSATLVLFGVGIVEKLQSGVVLRHTSPELNDLMHGAIWLLPLLGVAMGFVSGSDTLRGLSLCVFVITLPFAAVGWFMAVFSFGAYELEDQIQVGHHVFAAYTTNYRGALGDYGLEVWRNSPLLLGFSVSSKLPVGGEGYYFKHLEGIDDQCVSVGYSTASKDEVVVRKVCVDES